MVHIAQERSVRTLTLDSPKNKNALSTQLMAELADALGAAAADRGVRVIVVTGAGSVFCSGADLRERAEGATNRLPEILDTIRHASQPVIAKVNGHARGGGIGLIAAADLAVASAGASFAFSEVRVGVAPAMILVPLVRVCDPRFLARMTLSGEVFSATHAAAGGLLSAVVDEAGSLDQWVDSAVASFFKSAPGAVAATKELLAELPGREWQAALEDAHARSVALFAGAEAAEGMAAFLEKRAASWDPSGQ